ncbi:hypothetical protein Tco_1378437 [Tanacetum coccineum]
MATHDENQSKQIKECYKSTMEMAKRYYEEQQDKQEKPEDLVGKAANCRDKKTQAYADIIAEIGDSLDGTQGRIAQDDGQG